MKIITAHEARELAVPTPEEYLRILDDKIREAAARKERCVIIRDNPFASWLYDEKTLSKDAKSVLSELKAAGYTVSLHYLELQFVDMGLEIAW
jgi:predicted ABC-type ATPase